MKLLCLSNGHGEDIIAVRILQHLRTPVNNLAALPLVGEGQAYQQLPDIPIIGRVQKMPSGGFIYMDSSQLLGDLKGGLLQLLYSQVQTVRQWGKEGGFILAVGDIVPLFLAWLSGAEYAFVGTAKSEYYLRDENGQLSRQSWWQKWEGWSGSVYLPWERWLMTHPRCRVVFPRDRLTTETLQRWSIPAVDLGNPMMDNLEPGGIIAPSPPGVLNLTLLPGSRSPEAYENWRLILAAVSQLKISPLRCLAAIAPSLDLDPFGSVLKATGWVPVDGHTSKEQQLFQRDQMTMLLTREGFNDCLHLGDMAIAMAGTATEQFVGLGKPAIAIPGKGPQFTPAFAEAQSRLLGPSLILAENPQAVAGVVRSLLQDSPQLATIAANGRRRLGEAGAGDRIADYLISQIFPNVKG